MNSTQETLRELAERGVGFDMNPTMMFTTAESMYSQWLDYFTRLDREWRERVAAAADTLSSPPADDVREALTAILAEWSKGGMYTGHERRQADAILAAFEVRPRGSVTESDGYLPGETYSQRLAREARS